MKTVNGVYASAKIFTDTIEDYALSQIQMLCNKEAFKGCTEQNGDTFRGKSHGKIQRNTL